MAHLWFFLLGLLISPALLFFLHAALAWAVKLLRLPFPSPAVALVAMGAGLLLAAAWGAALQGPAGCLYAAIVYGCFAHAYFHLFLMGETARRLHILYELKTRGPMTRAQIEAHYGSGAMLDARLHRLVAMQQVRREQDRFVLQKSLLCYGSLALMLWAKALGFRSEALR